MNTLRLAKKKLGEQEYEALKKDAFEGGKDGRALREQMNVIIREHHPPDPDKVHTQRRQLVLGRLVRTLKSSTQEAEHAKFLPKEVIKQLYAAIEKVEAELARR